MCDSGAEPKAMKMNIRGLPCQVLVAHVEDLWHMSAYLTFEPGIGKFPYRGPQCFTQPERIVLIVNRLKCSGPIYQ